MTVLLKFTLRSSRPATIFASSDSTRNSPDNRLYNAPIGEYRPISSYASGTADAGHRKQKDGLPESLCSLSPNEKRTTTEISIIADREIEDRASSQPSGACVWDATVDRGQPYLVRGQASKPGRPSLEEMKPRRRFLFGIRMVAWTFEAMGFELDEQFSGLSSDTNGTET